MDSCNVMRGSKNGLEKKLRETVCPNFLASMLIVAITYITTVRYFQKCSANISNIFFQSIYSDFKWSEDHRNILKDICFQLGLTYRRPKMYSLTRCLKIHDIAIQTEEIFDALVEFFYAFFK